MNRHLKIALLATIGATCVAAFGQGDIYKAKCQMCHGQTGLADTPAGKALQAHSFSSPDYIKLSDDSLIAIVKNGKGKMPAFSGKITDGEITSLVTYTRTLGKK